jgi:hypothetical protein
MIVWHGTCSTLANEILADGGFVPEPPRKRWSADTGNLASHYGTYFTNNWMTAWSAAGQAEEKFGGERVIFEVDAELLDALVDEDHLPSAIVALAHGNGVVSLLPRNAWEILYLRGDLGAVMANGMETYLEHLQSRFGPSLPVDDRLRKSIAGYLMATLRAAAALHNPEKPWDDPSEFKLTHETQEMRDAQDEVAAATRGMVDRAIDSPYNWMVNMRIDRPVGFDTGDFIVNVIEVAEPRKWDPEAGIMRYDIASPENPYKLRVLYGELRPEFMAEFMKSIVGMGREGLGLLRVMR